MKNMMVCRILKAAEDDLVNVIESLANAQPDQLAGAQQLLERMVGTLGEIEASARRDARLPIKEALLTFRGKLGKAEAISATALDSLGRQATLAGLEIPGAAQTIQLQA